MSITPAVPAFSELPSGVAPLERRMRREWFAVFTRHQHESSVVKHLERRAVEAFVPVYESVHVWKNRQKKRIVSPLFPSYVFARIRRSEIGAVLGSPGVVRLAGNLSGPVAVSDAEIELLRSERYRNGLRPFSGLAAGERVRIARGAMKGVEGMLVRRNDGGSRFVLRVDCIQQSVTVAVAAEDLEPAETGA